MIDVVMPQLGESVAEGTVAKWLVREGDFVKREQPLLEVATDKADTEIPAPQAGRVARIAAAEGAVVAKDGLLCQIDETAEQSGDAVTPKGESKQAAKAEESKPAPKGEAQGQEPKSDAKGNEGEAAPKDEAAPKKGEAPAEERSVLSTPSTKKLARESGVDLRQVQGTGDHGRITRDDVMRATTAPAPAAPPATTQTAELSQMIQAGGGFVPPIPTVGFGAYKVPPYIQKAGDEVVPFNRRRRITADHMVFSKVTAPHVVTVAEVDLHATSKLRDQHKDKFKKSGVSLTFLAFVCAAAVKSLREHPDLNSRVLDNAYVRIRAINLGVAVDTPGGLIVPSIKNADELSLLGLARGIDDVAGRARAGKTTADDLSGTTFSVSNPGLKGNLFGGAIISQPNVGILRMGEIKKRPVVVTRDGEDSIAIHPVMFMALSYDHRIVDGVLANSFLWRVADILGRGEFEL
ncbi:dihydrolipoamide acetyltransferase family protein [Chondromyces apiculatus]|uniref:Dihydrolipoamide acetyltransferase component of pyruvate dehydrogenase complex n=1 Tax=Chondromyces apiculatus DSM 436 TaxID=1192034 RepID=A0A017SVS9_9BACT|nr:dihydrolipoamide acetyltransferase family protein [Chondromyces apiculatus]EYF00887.1 Dihydrolipoamide acyltransferase component of branched-chain alpha-keto acid dehydrogenase complex [Chondromyces apiculatus DSM 436]